MALSSGTRLGQYEIRAPIGAGGMGEVYRATDTKLRRDVALKVLPSAFVRDSDRMARFTREAQMLAALNHPNIAAIYGVEDSGGVRALVMELVEGPTLADRIAGGPIPLEESLRIVRQIAEALEYAHEKGVMHRDLKPANVKVTPEGVVKVLDFGLAKAVSDDPPVSDPSLSPTLTIGGTQAGVILGTAAYMSPEQAHGRTADRRADIWSFGAVLYEMLTTKLAFTGESVSDTLASVLKVDPDWNSLPAATPASIRKLIRQCLTKDRKQRLQAIGDARIAIDDYLANPSEEPVTERRSPSKLPWIVSATALSVLLILALGALWRATRPEPKPLIRLDVEMGPDAILTGIGGPHVVISPDGTRLVYRILGTDGRRRLATRPLDQLRAISLAGTENGTVPFFSPNGQWVGFFADGKLKKILAQGGGAVTLCDAPNPRGGSWGDDDNIVAALDSASGLSLVSSSGGIPQPLTQLNKEKRETTHRFPQVLPEAKAVLFVASGTTGNYDEASIEVQSLKTGARKTLYRGAYFGHYLPTGHLIFMRQGVLFAAPLNLDRLELYGPPVPVLEDVPPGVESGSAHFHFSQTGTVVYRAGRGEIEGRAIFWLENTGKTRSLRPNQGVYTSPRFAPDGRRLAVTLLENGKTDVWIYDLDRDSMTRLTSAGGNHSPVWTPDGKHIVFGSTGKGLSWIRADGAGETRLLTESTDLQIPASFALDGKRLAFVDRASGTGYDIWTLPIAFEDRDNPKPGKPEPFLRTTNTELYPAFSPDGRWLAYASSESGILQVYVRPFPGPGGKWQISTGGGAYPMWSPKAHELFLRAADGRIMVARYTAKGDSFLADKPRVWSERRLQESGTASSLDISPDGKSFAVLLPPEAIDEQKPPTEMTFLFNFFDELRRRVPVR